jgi:hypothetical protein
MPCIQSVLPALSLRAPELKEIAELVNQRNADNAKASFTAQS